MLGAFHIQDRLEEKDRELHFFRAFANDLRDSNRKPIAGDLERSGRRSQAALNKYEEAAK